jgi:quercetin dioxygenase-like cupin family protein
MRPEAKSLDEGAVRPVDRGIVQVVELDGATLMRTTFEPGWRWSECVKPIVGGESCQVNHVGYCVSGRLHVRMENGDEMEIRTGDASHIPPGHDAWVVGDEPVIVVDWYGASNYARKG